MGHSFRAIRSLARGQLCRPHYPVIAYKELFPVIVAAYLWGPLWVTRRVEFLCEETVVVVLKSGTSTDPNLMVLLHYLLLFAVHHSFSFTSSLVRGKVNPVADALSHFQFEHFR